MEKPRFQFGLKSVFVVMTGIAALAAVGRVAGWLPVLAVLFWPIVVVVLIVLSVAIGQFIEQLVLVTSRLVRWARKLLAFRSINQPPHA
jgi:hypothetical protein